MSSNYGIDEHILNHYHVSTDDPIGLGSTKMTL